MGGIESTQGEKKALLPKTESKPASGPTFNDVAVGNLPQTVEIIPAYSTISPARVLEKEPVRVPSLAMPRLEIDRNGSIKLILPFHGEESLARKLSDAIYYLFFYNPIPSYLSFRDPGKNGLDNLYVQDEYRKKVDAKIDFLNGLIELIGACGISSQHFIATLQLIYDEREKRTPSLKEFIEYYLGLNAAPDKYGNEAIIAKFDFVYEKLKNIFDSGHDHDLYFQRIGLFANEVCSLTPYEDAPADIKETAYKNRELAQQNCEMSVLYLVLRHQQAWLSTSPDPHDREKAVSATDLLNKVDQMSKSRIERMKSDWRREHDQISEADQTSGSEDSRETKLDE
jgi:hypothetical protein